MSKMPSVMKSTFSQVPKVDIPRSSFDRSHGYKTTFDAGYLVPVFVDEVLPGDTFNLKMASFARLATPIKPIMDNMFLETFFFFVPNRLVWDNWEKFMGAQDNPGDSTDYIIPATDDSNIINMPQINSIYDYMGVPVSKLHAFNLLPARAYNLIWNEWFRDQNLQDSATVDKGDSDTNPNFTAVYPLRRRGKRHDYFTSALPWPQKGESVRIPMAGQLPIDANGRTYIQPNWSGSASAGTLLGPLSTVNGAAGVIVNPPTIDGNLRYLNDTTINQLREAFQVQKLLERDARGGTRYIEIIRSHFGVTSPDARLQRPEYLGGGSTYVNISPIAQTQRTDTTPDSTPQGNLAAIGTASASGHGFAKSFVEHGYIIGLVNVRADLTYQQGLNRLWSRQTRFDFFFPTLAHLGEQAVLNKEIYLQGKTVSGGAPDEAVFGYQERYAEYRYKPSLVTGLFRSAAPASLDFWHLAQDFGDLPVLSSEFIEDNPPIDRVIAVPDEPHFLFDAYFSLRCARPMPVHGIPGMTDHF